MTLIKEVISTGTKLMQVFRTFKLIQTTSHRVGWTKKIIRLGTWRLSLFEIGILNDF